MGKKPYRESIIKLYEEIVVDEEKVIYTPVIGGAFAFVRIKNAGWGVLLKKDVHRYMDNIRADKWTDGVCVKILTYDNLLYLTLKHINGIIRYSQLCSRHFKEMMAEFEDQESIFKEEIS